MSTRLIYKLSAIAVCFALVTGSARGARRGTPQAELPPALLTDLDSPQFMVREAATRKLTGIILSEREITLDDLVAVLQRASSSLTPEQFDRLLHIAEICTFQRRQGVIGIRLGRAVNGVRVDHLLGQAPSSAVLRVGDVITAINGEALPSDRPSDRLMEIITPLSPGIDLLLEIIRDDERMTVTVKMADGGVLEDFSEADVARFRLRHWQQIRDLLVPPAPVATAVPIAREGRSGDPEPARGSGRRLP